MTKVGPLIAAAALRVFPSSKPSPSMVAAITSLSREVGLGVPDYAHAR
jgi:hypothetical protein